MSTALIVGRFQPFHLGHYHYIKEVLNTHDKLIIIIGSSQESNTFRNPFSFRERKKMVELCFPAEVENGKLIILGARDFPENNEKWLANIMAKVGKITSKVDVVYTGDNMLVAQIFSSHGFRVVRGKRYKNISSTRIRNLISQGKEWKNLVPPCVYDYILSINGVERIRKTCSKNK